MAAAGLPTDAHAKELTKPVRDGVTGTEEFQLFVHVLSSLMKDEVKRELASFFEIHDENTGGKFGGDNVAFCNLMRRQGIISPSTIEPLKDALRQCDKHHISNIAADMFTLFTEGKFDESRTNQKDTAGFKVFLEMLSLLMKEEVKRGLESVFDFSDTKVSRKLHGDNVAVCNVLEEKGIISSMSIRPLTTALRKVSKRIAYVAEKFFEYLNGEHPRSLNSFDEEKEVSFNRLLDMLSLLMTEEVQESLGSVFDIPEVHTEDKIRGSNAALCYLLKEKKIVSSSSIRPLIIVLTVCRQRLAAKLASEMLSLFKKKSLPLSNAVDEEKENEYQTFLKILSFIMTKEVKQDLKSFFAIPEVQSDGNFNGDNVAFCNHLREMGIISPLYIHLLTIPLRECGRENGTVAVFAETLFQVFKEKRLLASKRQNEKGNDFQAFLNIVSLLMTNKVKEGLRLFFDFPEHTDVGNIHGDSTALCNVLTKENIISSSYIELFAVLMRAYATQPAIKIFDRAVKLFKEKSLDDPSTLKGKKEAEFQRFLDILSLLMTDTITGGLGLFFDLTQVQSFHTFEDHSTAICYLLKEKCIISQNTIELLLLALQESDIYYKKDNSKVANTCNEIFELFKGGKLICETASLEEEKEGDFQRFLDILSLLMSTKMKPNLGLHFDFHRVQPSYRLDNDSVALCCLLRKKGVISHNDIEPLTILLKESRNYEGADVCKTLFQLFKEGKLGAATSLGEEEGFQRFLTLLSTVMKDEVKVGLTWFFGFPDDEIDQIVNDNVKFCNHLRMKLIISPAYISPVIYALNVMRTSLTLDIPFGYVAWHDSKHLAEGRFPGLEIFFSSDDYVKFISEIQTQFNMAMSTGLDHWKEITQGNIQSIDYNAGNNDEVQDSDTVPLDTKRALDKDLCQRQNTNITDAEYENENLEDRSFNTDVCSHLEASSPISNSGDIITISDTGVELEIPQNAFYDGSEDRHIELKILPRQLYDDPADCFEDHTTVMVEILPNNLQLKHPVKLTLPHCLIIRDTRTCEVKVFISHHEQGQKPRWEDASTTVQYNLSSTYCTIWLKSFCWVKYTVNGKEVEAKKLFLYILGQRYTKCSERVIAEVGYYPALPENHNMIFRTKLKKSFVGDIKTYIFFKQPERPLQIKLLYIDPDNWKLLPTSASSKTILYVDIEFSNECSYPFVFKRKGPPTSFPTCTFCISQGERPSEVCIDMANTRIEPSSGQEIFEGKSVLAIENKEEIVECASLAVAEGHAITVRNHQERTMTVEHRDIPSTSKSLCDYPLGAIASSVSVSDAVHTSSLPPTSCLKFGGNDISGTGLAILAPAFHAEMKSNIDDVARVISKHWEQVARRLGIETHDVDCIRTEHSNDLHKQVVSMLDRWMMIKGDKANVGRLIEALENCGLKLPADKVRRIFNVS